MNPVTPRRPIRVAVHTMWWLPSGIDAAHLTLSLVLVGCALVLALPSNTFATSHVYQVFIDTWPHTERGWSLMFLAPGMLGLASWRISLHRRWSRFILAVPLTASHVFLAAMAYEGNPAGLMFVLFGVLALLGLWRLAAEGNVRWEML